MYRERIRYETRNEEKHLQVEEAENRLGMEMGLLVAPSQRSDALDLLQEILDGKLQGWKDAMRPSVKELEQRMKGTQRQIQAFKKQYRYLLPCDDKDLPDDLRGMTTGNTSVDKQSGQI